MERQLTTAEFIEHLKKADLTLQRAHDWETQQQSRHNRVNELNAEIARLTGEVTRLTASVTEQARTVAEQIRQQQAAADQDLDTYRGTIEAAKSPNKFGRKRAGGNQILTPNAGRLRPPRGSWAVNWLRRIPRRRRQQKN